MISEFMPTESARSTTFTLNNREDGRVEVVCKHEIGHTISAPKGMGKEGFVHGCDGCCGTEEFKKYVEGVRVKDSLRSKVR